MTEQVSDKFTHGSVPLWLRLHRRWHTRRELWDWIDSHVAGPRWHLRDHTWR